MERLPFTKKTETASKEWTTLKMKRSRNLLKPPLILLAKLQLWETLTDSMFTTTTQRDLNGMKFVASKLRITTQLHQ